MLRSVPLELGKAGIVGLVAYPDAARVELSLLSVTGGPTITWALDPAHVRALADALSRGIDVVTVHPVHPDSLETVQLGAMSVTVFVAHAWSSLTFVQVPGPSVQQRLHLDDLAQLVDALRWAADRVEAVAR